MRRKGIVWTVGLLIAAYSGVYLFLSLAGRYEPAFIGLTGVRRYYWAPRGFVSEYRWRKLPRLLFLPLHSLDTHLWHTWEDAHSDEYPVNEVPDEEIGKVYRAWKR